MSDKKGQITRRHPLTMLKKLEEAARKGDPRAKTELRKLRGMAAMAQVSELADQVQAAHAVAEQLNGEDADEEVFGADDLDIAAHVAEQHSDELNRKVALRNHQWTQLDQTAPFVRNNPPSVMQGIIGNQQEVQLGQTIEVANWAGHDAETTNVTITAAPVQQLNVDLANEHFRPYGILQFGTKGFSARVEFDICRGVQFTVGASAAVLQIALEDTTSLGTNPTASMKLVGMLSFRVVTHQPAITRTKYLEAVDNNNTTEIVVPPFARNLSFWRAPTSTAVLLNFVDAQGNIVYDYLLAAGQYLIDPIPLAGDIASIVLTGGAGPKNPVTLGAVRAIFGLGL